LAASGEEPHDFDSLEHHYRDGTPAKRRKLAELDDVDVSDEEVRDERSILH
jgi:hypothetical protein